MFKVLTIYGRQAGHVTRTVSAIFRSPKPWRLQIKFGYNWPSGFRGDVKSDKCGRTMGGQTTDDEA